MTSGTAILAAWQGCLTLRGTQQATGATRAMIVSVLQSHGIDYRRADKQAQPIPSGIAVPSVGRSGRPLPAPSVWR